MKIKRTCRAGGQSLICAGAVGLFTLNAHAYLPTLAASNTNNVNWGNAGVYDTLYNNTGDLFDALDLSLTVAGGSTFTFESLDVYFGYNGAGTGGAPSPYLEIIDGSGNVLATTTPMTLTTPRGGIAAASSQAAFAPYLNEFYTASPFVLNSGSYKLSIFDTGEQLELPRGGAAAGTGVSVTLTAPYNAASLTPALLLYGTTSVPEPSTYGLMLSGLAGFLAFRLRGKQV